MQITTSTVPAKYRDQGRKHRVSVRWSGFGFDRDFATTEETKAYVQGLKDAQANILSNWAVNPT